MPFKPKFEQFANDAISTLNAAIDNSTTSLVLVSNGGIDFPDVGNYRLRVEQELMLVTARTADTLTVVRAIEGTTAAAHQAGVQAALILTEESIRRLFADHNPMFGSGLPPGPLNSLTDGTGAALTESSFSWINQSTTTATDLTGNVGIKLIPPVGTGQNLRIKERAAPSTPYTIYGAFNLGLHMSTGVSHAGFCFREVSSGKVRICALACEDVAGELQPYGIYVGNYASPSSFFAWNFNVDWGYDPKIVWLAMEDDGTNLKFHWSPDGVEFMEISTALRGGYFTTGPDKVGFYINATEATVVQHVVLNHWSEQ